MPQQEEVAWTRTRWLPRPWSGEALGAAGVRDQSEQREQRPGERNAATRPQQESRQLSRPNPGDRAPPDGPSPGSPGVLFPMSGGAAGWMQERSRRCQTLGMLPSSCVTFQPLGSQFPYLLNVRSDAPPRALVHPERDGGAQRPCRVPTGITVSRARPPTTLSAKLPFREAEHPARVLLEPETPSCL